MPSALTPPDRRRLEALQRWANLLDAAFGIPGTGIRFGIDALVGLIPGAGDALAGLFSATILLQGARFGVPRLVLVRMVFNALVDVVVGAVPFLGDLFDVGWKANLRNVRLLDRFVVQGQRTPTRGDYLFVTILLVILVAITALPLVALTLLVAYLT
ncbi:MAG: DUF4112 domain-containing protein [Acidobacteria bacterium]|nr:DUF4112 domain-containing protein [Acidobacteriota bacterium]